MEEVQSADWRFTNFENDPTSRIEAIYFKCWQSIRGRIFVNHHSLGSLFYQSLGTDNIKAEGKIDLGKRFITASDLLPEEILLVGDTIHDLQVANEIGCSVLLFSQGHNSKNQLSGFSVPIINDLMEVSQYLQH